MHIPLSIKEFSTIGGTVMIDDGNLEIQAPRDTSVPFDFITISVQNATGGLNLIQTEPLFQIEHFMNGFDYMSNVEKRDYGVRSFFQFIIET
jgi:hypothetical protein